MNLTTKDLDEMQVAARQIADEAGMFLLEGLGRDKKIEYKGEVDLVTQYDRMAEDLIKERLSSRFPEIDILAEESAGDQVSKASTCWIVDPLDGTTNFSHGHPVFAVSIGLQNMGQPVLGVVNMPALNLSVWAREGGGAFCNGEPCHVSSQSSLGNSLVATGFPYDRRSVEDDNTREYKGFIKSAQGVRRCGAAAVDLAFVARGVYDGFFEPRLKPWDLAAGIVLVQEAGGRVTDYDGNPLDIFRGWVVASNNLIHQPLLEVIQIARESL
jgi:myo-inositol-1(or 4)-monophosphatase